VGSLIHEISDHAMIMLDYYGLFASIEVNWFTPHKVRTLVATGSDGIAYLDYINQTIELYNGDNKKNIKIDKQEPLKIELQDFLDSVGNNHQPLVDGGKARDILDIAIRARNGHVYRNPAGEIPETHGIPSSI
jgi:UDP-N-acetylglucosamine 3-dehydrogenase